jgi:acetaldehyde dehydrogenase/alcohol dehydrogenase
MTKTANRNDRQEKAVAAPDPAPAKNEAAAAAGTAPDTRTMVDTLGTNAGKAIERYMLMDQEAVDKVVHAMALAGLDAHMRLAKLAVEETGRGVFEDKIIKNMFATEYIWHSIKEEKTVGIIAENELEGYIEVAEPVG